MAVGGGIGRWRAAERTCVFFALWQAGLLSLNMMMTPFAISVVLFHLVLFALCCCCAFGCNMFPPIRLNVAPPVRFSVAPLVDVHAR